MSVISLCNLLFHNLNIGAVVMLCFDVYFSLILFQFKWYSRRIALGALYKATELYLVQDKSADHQQTWDFLSRRIVELFQMHDLLKGTENLGSKSAETFSSAFSTVSVFLWTSTHTIIECLLFLICFRRGIC